MQNKSKIERQVIIERNRLLKISMEREFVEKLIIGENVLRDDTGALVKKPSLATAMAEMVDGFLTDDGKNAKRKITDLTIVETLKLAFDDKDDIRRISSIMAAELLEVRPDNFNRTIRKVIERYPDFDKNWIIEDTYRSEQGKLIPFYSLSSNGLLFIWSRGPKPRRAEMRYRQIMIQVLLIERLRLMQTIANTIFDGDVRRSNDLFKISANLLTTTLEDKFKRTNTDTLKFDKSLETINRIIIQSLPIFGMEGDKSFEATISEMKTIANMVTGKWITRVGKKGKYEMLESFDKEVIESLENELRNEILKHIDDKMFVHGKLDKSHDSMSTLSQLVLSEEDVKIKDLVDSMGVTLTISTQKASEMFDIEHYNFLRACKEVKEAYPEMNPEWIANDTYKAENGKNNPMYNLSSEGFILISQLIHSNVNEKTELFRNKLQHEVITRLRFYQELIHVSFVDKLTDIREFGKSARQLLTNAIDNAVGDRLNGAQKGYLYASTTSMLYTLIQLPMIYRKVKLKNRDRMPKEVLEVLAIIEIAIANYIDRFDFDDDTVYDDNFIDYASKDFVILIDIWVGQKRLDSYYKFIKDK